MLTVSWVQDVVVIACVSAIFRILNLKFPGYLSLDLADNLVLQSMDIGVLLQEFIGFQE